jgi:DNA-binding response OmpR family regulator
MPQPSTPRLGAILLVEDCYDIRIGLAQLLTLNGYRVTDTADGEHAIDELNANPQGFALICSTCCCPVRSAATDVRRAPARRSATRAVADGRCHGL